MTNFKTKVKKLKGYHSTEEGEGKVISRVCVCVRETETERERHLQKAKITK